MGFPNPLKLVSALVIPPWVKYAAMGLAALAIALTITLTFRSCDKRHEEINANFVNQGVTKEVTAEQSETINAVEVSTKAVRQPTSDQLNVVCERYDRNCPNSHRP